MNNNATIAGYILLVTLACLSTQPAFAQNTIIPQPIQHHHPMFWDTTLFVGKIDTWVNGHQWGTAHSRKLNDGLQMNLTNDAGFSYLSNEALESLYRLGKGVNGTNYIMWGFPFQGGSNSLVEKELDTRWYGMRWEPAENAGLVRRATWGVLPRCSYGGRTGNHSVCASELSVESTHCLSRSVVPTNFLLFTPMFPVFFTT